MEENYLQNKNQRERESIRGNKSHFVHFKLHTNQKKTDEYDP